MAIPRITNLISFLAWSVLLIIAIAAALMPGGQPPGQQFHLDKVFHFILYALLSALPILFIRDRKWAVLLAASSAPIGFALEFAQKFVASRTFSPSDLIANNLGILFGLTLAVVFRIRAKRLRIREQPMDTALSPSSATSS